MKRKTRKTEFTIVCEAQTDDFETKVEKYLSDEWSIVGQVVVNAVDDLHIWHVPLIRYAGSNASFDKYGKPFKTRKGKKSEKR